MTTRGLSPTGPMSFLAGDSAMARLIRAHDWSGHAFGLPDTWPQALRAALGICLSSALPVAIYWGPELRLLYNDAWAVIPGPRHPAALGERAEKVWADIWHVIRPQFAHVHATGEGLFLEDQMLPMRRFGAPEETYWSYSFSPIRDEHGSVAGIFNAGNETTRNVLAQRQMRFRLELGETLRRTEDPEAGRRAAMAMLGTHLGVDRVGLAERQGSEDRFAVVEQWHAPGTEPIDPATTLSVFGAYVGGELAAGRVLRIDDAPRDPRIDAQALADGFEPAGIAAALAVPWMEGGALAGCVFAHQARSRNWNEFEVSTVEALLERTRIWIERARAADRERIMVREVDHRARNVLAVVQSVVRLTPAEGTADGFRRKIEERIAALARAHTVLAARGWADVDLGSLLAEELVPYARQAQVAIKGPPVALPAELAQSVALVLHELTTNAAMHGALGVEGGALAVTWGLGPEGMLGLDWRESLPATQPAARWARPVDGFGSLLLGRVVEAQLGGRIEQTLGEGGLVCRITFPLAGPATAAPVPAPAVGEGPPRVLIVEDEALVAMDLETMVADLGYRVHGVCALVDEALRLVEASPPDVAVLDANLRGVSSVPLAERLRERGVPVVFATGYNAIAGLSAALADVQTLSKPVSQAALAEAIGRALGGRA